VPLTIEQQFSIILINCTLQKQNSLNNMQFSGRRKYQDKDFSMS